MAVKINFDKELEEIPGIFPMATLSVEAEFQPNVISYEIKSLLVWLRKI